MEMNGEMLDLYAAAGAAFGLVECFFGYRILRFLLGVIGFLIGAVLAGGLGFELSGGSELVSIVAGIAGGFAAALLIYLLYFVGVFAVGSALGLLIASFVLGLTGVNPVPWILAASGAAAGILSVLFRKPMIILATSFGGSCAAVTGISYLLSGDFNPLDPGFMYTLGEDQLYRMAIIWFALGVFGFVVQYMTLQEKADTDREPGAAGGGEGEASERPSADG